MDDQQISLTESPKKRRTPAQWILGVFAVVGVCAAIVWRLMWPVTGVAADLILIVVMVLGAVALRIASRL
jgi:hypothetical protein